MECTEILLIIFVILGCFYFYSEIQKRKILLPPGPPGLPFVGNIHQISSKCPLKLSEWAKQYEKLYTIYFMRTPALVVNDAKFMKQMFGKLASTGKAKSKLLEVLYGGNCGVGNSEGEVWQEQHAFCGRVLKEFGRGSELEGVVLEEMEALCARFKEELEENDGRVFVGGALKQTTGSIIWRVISGERMEMNVVELLEEWREALQIGSNSGLDLFPWLKYIFPERSGCRRYVKAVKRIHEFVNRKFEEKKCSKMEGGGEGAKDIMTGYIDHVRKMEEKGSSFYGERGLQHSFYSVMALLMGGSETMSLAIHWLLFYLSGHPEVQEKVRKEIDQIVGNHRHPMLTDRSRMPYTEAVIQETLRMSSIAPLGAIHKLLEDVSFQQYLLPKGLLLISNMYHVHNDPDIWTDPEKFRPQRFLEMREDPKRNLKEYMVWENRRF